MEVITTTDLDTLRAALAEADARLALAHQDFEILNTELNERAEAAELCLQYDQAMEEINRQLSTFKLQPRQRTIDINVDMNVTLQVEGNADLDTILEALRQFFYLRLDDNDEIKALAGLRSFSARRPSIERTDI